MKINRRSIAAGLTVGVLAGGAGGAIAATTSGSKIATTSSTTSSRTTGGWGGYGYGWGWMSFARSGRQAALTYLGLSGSRLDSRLRSGKTLAGIASGQGESVAGLESAIESAVADSVNTDSALSASQESSLIANLRSFVDSVVTGTWDDAPGPWQGGPDGPMTSGSW
jgi:hypothetical protein